jgi:mono/diheme cytochrome c family protein
MKERFNFKTGSMMVLMLAIAIMLISSCYYPRDKPGWEYMPDMAHSLAYETYTSNPFFPDSMNAIQPVPRTIPRGVYMPFHYSTNPTGYDSAGLYLHFPSGLNQKDLDEGKRLFGINCAVCHGFGGNADGSIVVNSKLKNPFPPPPSYFAENLINLPEGKAYYSVHYGKNLMGAYSRVLDHDQVWKVVYYVKSLQKHHMDSVAVKGATAVATADTTKK